MNRKNSVYEYKGESKVMQNRVEESINHFLESALNYINPLGANLVNPDLMSPILLL